MTTPSNLPILIIEDSPEDFEAIVRALTKAGVVNPVYRFSYGEDAFDFLKQRGRFFKNGDETRPALILLDLNLPGSDGLKVLQAVRADDSLRAIPVIVLSTSSDSKGVEDCYLAGANSYITKPAGPEQLYDVVRKLKEYWLEMVLLPGADFPPAPDIRIPHAPLAARASAAGGPGLQPGAARD